MCEASEKITQNLRGPADWRSASGGRLTSLEVYFFLHFDKLPWRHGLEQGITDNRSPRGAPLATAEQEYEWFFPQGTKCVKVSSGSIQKKFELGAAATSTPSLLQQFVHTLKGPPASPDVRVRGASASP